MTPNDTKQASKATIQATMPKIRPLLFRAIVPTMANATALKGITLLIIQLTMSMLKRPRNKTAALKTSEMTSIIFIMPYIINYAKKIVK